MPGAHSARGGLQKPEAAAAPAASPRTPRSGLDFLEGKEAKQPLAPRELAPSSLALWAAGDREEEGAVGDWLEEEAGVPLEGATLADPPEIPAASPKTQQRQRRFRCPSPAASPATPRATPAPAKTPPPPARAPATLGEATTPATPEQRRRPEDADGAPARDLQAVLGRQADLEKQAALVSQRVTMTQDLMEGQLRLAQMLTQLAESLNAKETREGDRQDVDALQVEMPPPKRDMMGDGNDRMYDTRDVEKGIQEDCADYVKASSDADTGFAGEYDVDDIKPLYATDTGSADWARRGGGRRGDARPLGGRRDEGRGPPGRARSVGGGGGRRLMEPAPDSDSESDEARDERRSPREARSRGENAEKREHRLRGEGAPEAEVLEGVLKRRGSTGSMASLIDEKLAERRQMVHEKHNGQGGIYTIAWYADIYSTLVFAVACALMFYLWLTSPHGEAYVMTLFTTAIASLASFAKACNMGDYEIWGELIPFARYIDWITTTPLMLYELCHIAKASAGQIILVVGCDLLMLATGIIAAFVPWNPHKVIKNIWFGFSCFFYILMLVVLQWDVAKQAQKQSPATAKLFTDLQVLTKVVWSLYPLVVAVGRAHLAIISKPMEDILLCVLDTVSKIGMEGFIVVATTCIAGCPA